MTGQTAAGHVRAFTDCFAANCPGNLIRSIDPDPDDENVWPVKLRLDELCAVLDEHAAMTAELAELKAKYADTGTMHRELLARTYCDACGERRTSLAHLNECLSRTEGES